MRRYLPKYLLIYLYGRSHVSGFVKSYLISCDRISRNDPLWYSIINLVINNISYLYIHIYIFVSNRKVNMLPHNCFFRYLNTNGADIPIRLFRIVIRNIFTRHKTAAAVNLISFRFEHPDVQRNLTPCILYHFPWRGTCSSAMFTCFRLDGIKGSSVICRKDCSGWYTDEFPMDFFHRSWPRAPKMWWVFVLAQSDSENIFKKMRSWLFCRIVIPGPQVMCTSLKEYKQAMASDCVVQRKKGSSLLLCIRDVRIQ